MTPLLPADFTQPSLQTILRINLDGTSKAGRSTEAANRHRKKTPSGVFFGGGSGGIRTHEPVRAT